MTTAAARPALGAPPRMRALLAVRLATVVALVVGVVCQVVQSTDPTPPFLYFTVDSAALLALALGLSTAIPGRAWLDDVRGAATAGVVLSGIVFAAVIAPASETGTWIQPHDDSWVRTANVVLHGVAPVLAVADFLLAPRRPAHSTAVTALRWCLWPLAYLAVVLPLDLAGVITIPYAFLSASEMGWPAVLGATGGLFVVVVALGATLLAAHQTVSRRGSRTNPGPPGR